MKKKMFMVFIAGMIIVMIGGMFWLMDSYKATEQPLNMIENRQDINSRENGWLEIMPGQKSETGIIFYPGARVEPEAYVPLAFQISQQGFMVVIVSMPFNLAIFGVNEADKVIAEYEQITNWVIVGHSLGGAMAGRYIKNNPQKVEQLILLASYIDGDDDLSDFEELDVLSIYAENDEIVTAEDIEESKKYLPSNTEFIEIEGGNHSQFGFYGFQDNDGRATIKRSEQHNFVVEIISKFLK